MVFFELRKCSLKKCDPNINHLWNAAVLLFECLFGVFCDFGFFIQALLTIYSQRALIYRLSMRRKELDVLRIRGWPFAGRHTRRKILRKMGRRMPGVVRCDISPPNVHVTFKKMKLAKHAYRLLKAAPNYKSLLELKLMETVPTKDVEDFEGELEKEGALDAYVKEGVEPGERKFRKAFYEVEPMRQDAIKEAENRRVAKVAAAKVAAERRAVAAAKRQAAKASGASGVPAKRKAVAAHDKGTSPEEQCVELSPDGKTSGAAEYDLFCLARKRGSWLWKRHFFREVSDWYDFLHDQFIVLLPRCREGLFLIVI